MNGIQGFTGTRRGMTPAQRQAALDYLMADWPAQIMHGGAEGADDEIDEIVAPIYWEKGTGAGRLLSSIFQVSMPIIVLPTDATRQAMWNGHSTPLGPPKAFAAIRDVWGPSEPLARDRIIARRCTRLLACPGQAAEIVRSGTWATVRYARLAHKPITIIFPNGSVRQEA